MEEKYAQRLYKIGLVVALVNSMVLLAASLVGVLATKEIYPNSALQATYLTNDVANLFIVFLVLFLSIFLLKKKLLTSIYLFLAGMALITYNGIAYLFGVPFSGVSILYIAEIVLSLGGFALFFKNVNKQTMQGVLPVNIPEKLISAVLIGFGLLFLIRSLIQLINGVSGSNLAVDIADLCMTPFWIISGFLLWRKRSWGYTIAPIMLTLCCLLMLGLLFFFVFQPVLLSTKFATTDFIVILIFSLICFFPFVKMLHRVSGIRIQ